ncbi:hypothetical protein VOLCADRAFT_89797 [Volvox carteri f. nagariensis]|uniref:Uncharacterized protein n=1 Tax=Volvox carteri f. nagariensis TaxID=3068 RepID=D8TSN7_VOLCA|nr:uncharacterized protein VOLCADRAFT_89797 [Volvox carteri f. nagariensis]EFJ49403.1 hypothetical protein VOLCADRAFT_89797 [Volvox carteri f. nagariensis]|eukprot:XP_002949384.1 hypothetical protein VOLCADRAFT_89797 [Volvox carteri f. nagariensis]
MDIGLRPKKRILPSEGEEVQPKCRKVFGHAYPSQRSHDGESRGDLASALPSGGLKAGHAKVDANAREPIQRAIVDLTLNAANEKLYGLYSNSTDDDDFCEIVSGPAAAGPAKPGAATRRAAAAPPPVWDLTTEATEDSSDSLLEISEPDADTGTSTVAPAAAAAATIMPVAAPAPAPRSVADAVTITTSARASPSTRTGICPVCQADDQDAVQRETMRAAERQLSAGTTVALLAPGGATSAAVAEAAAAAGPQCCASCRYCAALATVEAAQHQVCSIVARHPAHGGLRGWVFEVHHAASFNIEALRVGSSLRAERIELGGADIRVYDITDPRVTLAQAQLKACINPKNLRKLNHPKYAGLLKVVLLGFETKDGRRSSVLSYRGVSSAPISNAGLEAAVRLPGDHFFGLMWIK